jgi:microcystin-dependent protein
MDPFIGEIRIFGFPFAPQGWALCAGQLLSIQQNTALFSILGTQYGGNGTSNFALPNLQGSVSIGQGSGPGLTPRIVGETGGTATVTLTTQQLASHTHPANCSNTTGDSYGPAGTIWAADAGGANEYQGSENAVMNPQALANLGGGQPHNNLQPYLVLNYCIALNGIFPARG